MSTCDVLVPGRPADVFGLLLEPEAFAYWVVGARRIRAVDERWPEVGACFHHEVGGGPIKIKDSSCLEAVEASRRIVLRVNVRPIGLVARAELELGAEDGGTRVRMREYPVAGVWKLLWNPVLDGVMRARNVASLGRLRELAERRFGSSLREAP